MTDSNAKSRVLTLVFTDLADSTALKTARGDDVVDALLTRHREHVTRLAEESSGRVIDWAGDGCFLTFDTSSAAVMFALRLQQAHTDEPDLPGVRIGVHLGEVTERPGPDGAAQVKGLAVDVAARVQGLAKPGQVLMSASVYNSARQRLGVDAMGQPILWQIHGSYDLKGVDHPLEIGEAGFEGISPLQAPEAGEKAKPVRRAKQPRSATPKSSSFGEQSRAPRWALGVIAVLLIAVGLLVGRGLQEPTRDDAAPSGGVEEGTPITSLAVLPLDNLMNDPEQDYFADGMTEAITAELAKIKELKVISRTSVMQYKGTTKTAPEIARELGVEGLIEGSVLRSGDQVRITAQLIHAESDTHLWAESYDGTTEDVLGLLSEVALAIAEEVHVEVSGQEHARIATERTVEPAAYQYYLRGRHLMDERSPETLAQARAHFEKAIELDPEFADAYAGLARLQTLLPVYLAENMHESIAGARASAQRALEIDPTSSEAEVSLAFISQVYDWDWERAEQGFLRAIELSPGSAIAYDWYGLFLTSSGRVEEAIEISRKAADLDPLAPIIQLRVTSALANVGQTDEALALAQRSLEQHPDLPISQFSIGATLAFNGRTKEAIPWLKSSVRPGTHGTLYYWETMFFLAVAGEDDAARAMLREAEEHLGSAAHQSMAVAATAQVLGDEAFALEVLQRAVENRDFYLTLGPQVAFHKAFENNPRARDILAPVGMPDSAWFYPRNVVIQPREERAIEKIAVLPFENMSSDPEQVFFVDGMTEALIAELAKIRSLKVISRTSVMRYKGTDKSLQEIARELNVDGIVEGSVLKAGDQVRITAQLIRGATDEHMWSASRTAPLENILQLQAEVALSMTDEIDAAVTPEERTRIASAKVVNPKAYEYYTQGQDYLSRRDPDSFATARRLFESALELDPDFAPGHVGLSDVFFLLRVYGLMPGDEAASAARAEALKALELDPNLGAAYASLGLIYTEYDWEWDKAEEAFQRAIALSPGHAPGYHAYAVHLHRMGRADEALAMELRAYELNPVSPINGAWVAELLADVGSETEAEEQLAAVQMMYPDLPRVRQSVVSHLFELGRDEEALKAIEALREVHWDPYVNSATEIASLYALGRKDEARQVLERYVEARGSDGRDATNTARIAVAYVAVGDIDTAMVWFEKGYAERAAVMDGLNWIGRLKTPELRNDPRFQDLLRRMNFPEPLGSN